MRVNAKRTALAAVLVASVAVPFAWGAGVFQTYPIIGGAAYCASGNVSGAAQGGITGQGAPIPAAGAVTGTSICGQTVPAGPPALTGTEVFPVDLYTPGTLVGAGGPATADVPVTLIANGVGGTQVNTTVGTTASVVIANGISKLIYAGATAATYTSLTMPPNPMQNQQFCIHNAGSGILTLTAVVVGTSGQVFVQGAAPTTLPVEVASGAQTTVTNPSACWLYNVSNTTWYRTL